MTVEHYKLPYGVIETISTVGTVATIGTSGTTILTITYCCFNTDILYVCTLEHANL